MEDRAIYRNVKHEIVAFDFFYRYKTLMRGAREDSIRTPIAFLDAFIFLYFGIFHVFMGLVLEKFGSIRTI